MFECYGLDGFMISIHSDPNKIIFVGEFKCLYCFIDNFVFCFTAISGSTAEGLFLLEQNKLRAAIIGAIEVATKRCIQAKESG